MGKKTGREPPNKRWFPEKKAEMRRELLEEGKTLRDLAEREGVTFQRISRIVGKLDRKKSSPSPPGRLK